MNTVAKVILFIFVVVLTPPIVAGMVIYATFNAVLGPENKKELS